MKDVVERCVVAASVRANTSHTSHGRRHDSHQNLLEDQCVFIRGWRVTRTLVILRGLRGAAEPSPDLGGNDSESENQAVFFPTNHFKVRRQFNISGQYLTFQSAAIPFIHCYGISQK
jgi:hypothetical protein